MPQIDQIGTIYLSQLVWLLVVFALIYVIIGRWMLPRIEGTIHLRNDRIAGDLAAAEAARAEAGRIEADYAREMESAHRDARADVQSATDANLRDTEARLKASAEALEGRIHAAMGDLETARAGALAEVEGVAADAVRDIVKLVSGVDVDHEAARHAVRGELASAGA